MQDRFARSLGIAGPRPAEYCTVAETVVACTGGSRGWRPSRTANGSHVLFAGHIDNRAQLARDLAIRPVNDAELYAAGYSAWGDDVDLRLIGQFATIIVRPNGAEIRLARSPIDAPPLFFWHDAQRFIVASLPNVLFATGEVEQRIDEQKVADELFLNSADEARSWFTGVRRLACGQRAKACANDVAIESFYDATSLPQVRFKDERDYVAAANALLEEGTRAALEGFRRPAISLSGGLDSQAVAAQIVRCRPGEPIEAFTGVPEAEWDGISHPAVFGNERPHVEALAAIYPEIRPHWVDAPGLFLDHKIEAMFLLSGEAPANAANLHWIHESYAQARAAGCDVILDGGFGNVSFSFDGSGALATMFKRGHWRQLWREAGHLAPVHANSRTRALAAQAILPFAPDWLHDLLERTGLRKANNPFETWCPLDRAYAESTGVQQRAKAAEHDSHFRYLHNSRAWRDSMVMNSGSGSSISQAFDLIHGIESRDPTAYRPLVEFCLGLPDDQYLRDGEARRLARRMLRGRIPDTVLDETRWGSQSADWHLRLGRQREDLIAEIDRLASDQAIAGMLNLRALRQALAEWPATSRGETSPRLKLALTRGLTAARFVRFVEGRNG